jgi:uncharacterized repeat protein (TIGR03803 family)
MQHFFTIIKPILRGTVATILLISISSFSNAQNIGQLWGLASMGGDSGGGVIFRYTPLALADSIAHSFTIPGAAPQGNLIEASDGNFYGMTCTGGEFGYGTIFQCTKTGIHTILHSFRGGDSDGSSPCGSLVQGSDGNLYGVTAWGGIGSLNGNGVIFKCTCTGALTILHNFNGGLTDGSIPLGSLIQCSDGNFYGMTNYGGASKQGTIFKCTPTGIESILYSFAGGDTDGANPRGSLIQASDGNLYGMTEFGGPYPSTGSFGNSGTIFKCTLSGTETILHFFNAFAGDAECPCGSLIQANDGNLYGMGTGTPSGYYVGTLCRGAIFKCSTTGTEIVLSGNGSLMYPYGSLIQASDGNLYGMTYEGTAGIFTCSLTGTIITIHTFTGGVMDGASPYGSLIQASDGNLYGMTSQGGESGAGAIFKSTITGAESILYNFVGSFYGSSPTGSLILGIDSNLYGMTYSGGASSEGTIFKCNKSGTKTILHSFVGGNYDGEYPNGSLIQGNDGNLYGLTSEGGPFFSGGCSGNSSGNDGTIFKCTPAGIETILHIFVNGEFDGGNPNGSLIQGVDGNLYGMTSGGGLSGVPYSSGSSGGVGTIFKCTPTGTETILHNFMGGGDTDGAYPSGSLIQDSDGNFYGMTESGGIYNYGIIFKCTNTGQLTILYSFKGGAYDGLNPHGSLIKGGDGNFYGMTTSGGLYNMGIIFKCTPTGIETTLHNFSGGISDGASPYGSLILGSDSNFYGMTELGGAANYGTIFECTPSGSVTILDNLMGINGGHPFGDLLEIKGPLSAPLVQQENTTVGVYPNPNNEYSL